MYNSDLFDHGVPSSRVRNLVPISLKKFFRDFDVYSPDISHIIASGDPISFVNGLTACSTLLLDFIGTTYTNTFLVTNSWQQVLFRDDLPAFLVAKNVSMKNYSQIRLYRSIRSFVT